MKGYISLSIMTRCKGSYLRMSILSVIVFLSTTFSFGQIELDKFDELVLVDYQNWNFNRFYGRTYLVKLKETPLKLYDLKLMTGTELFEQTWRKLEVIGADSVEKRNQEINKYFEEIEKIKEGNRSTPEFVYNPDPILIRNLIYELVRKTSYDQILIELGLTKDSLEYHLETYLIKYLEEHRIKYKDEKLAYCKNKLKDYELFKRSSILLTHDGASSDYPRVTIELRNEKDTLTFYTEGQHPFMLPWSEKNSNGYSYNPRLSMTLGKLLPYYKHSNQDRLLGQRGLFGDYLTSLFFFTIKANCINEKKKLITCLVLK